MTNREILEAFAAQFSPPLKVVGTRNIDGMPVKDGYFCAAWEDTAKIGVTAFAFGSGAFKAYLESTGDPEHAGAVLAGAMGRFNGG